MSSEALATAPTLAAGVLARARLAVTGLFLLFGINVGAWAAHIPVVQARLAIDPGILGLALLCAAIGTILAQPILGVVMARTGSRLPTIAAGVAAMAVLPVAIFSPSLPFLFVASFAVGASWGGLNVGMNTQATEIEKLRGKPTLSSFHAAASVGMLAGSSLGGFLIGAGWGDGSGALGIGIVTVIASFFLGSRILSSEPGEAGPVFVLPTRAVVGLGVLAFLMFLVEGAMVDWSALFLATDKGADPAWAPAGFALFTASMALCRILGNAIVEHFGPRTVVTAGGAIIIVGILVAVLSPWSVVSMAGFGIVGVGAANIVPILMSTAARTPGMAPSVAISAVGTMLTAGFLVGPPLIGFVSSATTLSVGISLLSISGLAVCIAGFLRTWPAAGAR